jgi:type I restriction enzyme S subunit
MYRVRPNNVSIAEALSDVDALLGGLDRLIGEWEVKCLGDLGQFQKGSGIRRDDAQSGDLACVRYGELYTTHDNIIRTFASRLSATVAATARRLRRGDLLFAGSGETKEEIGKCAAIIDDIEAYAGGDVVILRPREGDSNFPRLPDEHPAGYKAEGEPWPRRCRRSHQWRSAIAH